MAMGTGRILQAKGPLDARSQARPVDRPVHFPFPDRLRLTPLPGWRLLELEFSAPLPGSECHNAR